MVINLLTVIFATLMSLSFFPDVCALIFSLYKFGPSREIDNRKKDIYLVVKSTSLLSFCLSILALLVSFIIVAPFDHVSPEYIGTGFFAVASISFIIGLVYLLLLKLAILLSKKIPRIRPWDFLSGELGVVGIVGFIGFLVVMLIKYLLHG